MSARVLVSTARAAAAALLLVGCLPGDTRPPPAVIHFLAEPGAAATEGLTTADGWHLVIEKLLVGLGDTNLNDGTLCNKYADGGYARLFDFTVPGKQTLSDVYGLGTCDPYFFLIPPYSSDVPLGQGVTTQDLAFMRARDWDEDPVGAPGIKAVHLRGRATRDTVTKTFAWSFRIGIRLPACANPGDIGSMIPTRKLHLRSGDELSLSVKVHVEELFRERQDSESPFRFDAIAGADIDGDQAITLEELFLAPGPEPEPEPGADAGPSPEGDAGPPSIGTSIYYYHLPRMVRLDDRGACLPADP